MSVTAEPISRQLMRGVSLQGEERSQGCVEQKSRSCLLGRRGEEEVGIGLEEERRGARGMGCRGGGAVLWEEEEEVVLGLEEERRR